MLLPFVVTTDFVCVCVLFETSTDHIMHFYHVLNHSHVGMKILSPFVCSRTSWQASVRGGVQHLHQTLCLSNRMHPFVRGASCYYDIYIYIYVCIYIYIYIYIYSPVMHHHPTYVGMIHHARRHDHYHDAV